jgi:hypothetical protein
VFLDQIENPYHLITSQLERKLPQKLIRHIKDQQMQMFEVTSPNSNPTGVKNSIPPQLKALAATKPQTPAFHHPCELL